MDNLYKLIQNSQTGDEDSTLKIINKFYPLIQKYSRKLNYDGADTDLIISLIEIVNSIPIRNNPNMKMDARIVGYINVSIKNKYIYFSKKNSHLKMEIQLNSDIADQSLNEAIEDDVFISRVLDNLPEMQKRVLKEMFIENKTVSQIANQLNISRQAVNKIKISALKNLRDKNIM